jgi:N-acetylglutamate synthase-like GNAT family acetyltransferase
MYTSNKKYIKDVLYNMVSTKLFKGIDNSKIYFEIRKKVFCDELNMDSKIISDIYDEFSLNVVVYEDEKAVATGRLIFKDGRYFIDKLCVLTEFRGNSYGELIIRMLVRKIITIGAEKTYSEIDCKYKHLFEKIGFKEVSKDASGHLMMMKEGDVGGHCS